MSSPQLAGSHPGNEQGRGIHVVVVRVVLGAASAGTGSGEMKEAEAQSGAQHITESHKVTKDMRRCWQGRKAQGPDLGHAALTLSGKRLRPHTHC